MILRSQDAAYTTEQKWLINEAGEKGGLLMHGDTLSVTLDALVPSASAFSARMATKLTLANSPTDFFRAAPAANFGDIVITGVTEGKKNEDFHSFSISCVASPFLDFDAA
jgi:hypothetical protein